MVCQVVMMANLAWLLSGAELESLFGAQACGLSCVITVEVLAKACDVVCVSNATGFTFWGDKVLFL